MLVAACEKRIDFPLKTNDPLLTVDASIETGRFPVVVLTKSFNFFSTITPQLLASSLIDNAEVFINADGRRIQLVKRELILPGNLKYVYYTCDEQDANRQLIGEEGKKYQLDIVWNQEIYTANTTIPVLRKTLDSLWWIKAPATPDTSTKIILKGQFTDPPEFGDYVRYFTRVNSEPFYPGFTSAFDDLFVNGTVYQIDIPRGFDRNFGEDFIEDQFFRRGDTITIKFSNIDRATYDFWRTVEFSYQSVGNPFSSPIKIMGNISNGALGYFGGYANQFRSIIIPPL